MIKSTVNLGIILIFILFLSSCKKISPQLPSNKGNVEDKSSASLLMINQNLTLKEDSIIKKFAEKDGSFKKNAIGFWYRISKTGKGASIKDSVSCNFEYHLLLLDGKTVEKGEKQIVIGKKQLIVGLEEGLKLMQKGDSATFIIPWYLGYGMKGYEQIVPPYTSIIYKIRMQD
ncbi:MAG: FKBP-type peptidyl-prolyl cis-trans isomerase [Paludibacter sp.]|nr:FKBP-type peptidyl-prolyl cis-trans isomerase [Paludibacter sp.]